MKLLNRTALIFITISLFVFFGGGILLYNIILSLTHKNINNELISNYHTIEFGLKNNPEILKNPSLTLPGTYEIINLDKYTGNSSPTIILHDTIIYDRITNTYKPYKHLSSIIEAAGHTYKISVFKSLIETNNLIEKITLAITLMALLYIVCVFFIIKITSKKIWSDFFYTLNKMNHFEVDTQLEKIVLPTSEISEFNALNSVLNKMIAKITQDFNNLKEFTENLTHEILTPLAIIKSKTELLLQQKGLNNQQAELLADIQSNLQRITQLNHGLVMLAKIENHQFTEKVSLQLDKLIDDQLTNFKDLIEAMNITVAWSSKNKLAVEMNSTLADLLLVNLMKNAIIHNYEGGKITLSTENNRFKISNTGKPLIENPEQMFERFSHSSNTKSLGIGLSIVKKICDTYNYDISYVVDNNIHEIIIANLK